MLNKFLRLFFPMFFCEPERARDDKGRLRADDKSTSTVNEAWVGGKAPVKKKRGRPPRCHTAASPVEVHGHYQCSVCKMVISDCCQGERNDMPEVSGKE